MIATSRFILAGAGHLQRVLWSFALMVVGLLR